MELIGHRACGGQYAENTRYAVREASKRVDHVELDVRRCGSGELVLFHDETLNRLTSADQPLAAVDYSTLRELTVMGTDERIPLLSEGIEAVPADVGIIVDLKEPGLVPDVVSAIADVPNDVALFSQDAEDLRTARELNETVELGYFCGDDPELELRTAIELSAEIDCGYFHLPFGFYGYLLNDAVPSMCHRHGLEIQYSIAATVEAANALVEPLYEAGVDRLVTDRWDVITLPERDGS